MDLEKSTFEGYSAAIGNRDLGNDVIQPGAFDKTIKERVASKSIKLLDQHNSRSTADCWGTVVDAKETKVEAKGDNAPSHKIWTKFEVSKSDPNAQIALKKVEEGILDQLSIGFQPVRISYEVDDEGGAYKDDPHWAWILGQGVRNIEELAWWETSLVIWAMNPEAQVVQSSLKSLNSMIQRSIENGRDVPEAVVQEVLKTMSLLQDGGISDADMQNIGTTVSQLQNVLESLKSMGSVVADPMQQIVADFRKEIPEGDKSRFLLWVNESVQASSFDKEVTEDQDPNANVPEEAKQFDDVLSDSKEATAISEDVAVLDVESISAALTRVASLLEGYVKPAETTQATETDVLDQDDDSASDTASVSDDGQKQEPVPVSDEGTHGDLESAQDTQVVPEPSEKQFPSQEELEASLARLAAIDALSKL